MRLFWSVVLTGGLLLVGLDVFESRREGRGSEVGTRNPPVMMAEDGTPIPPPPPP